LAKQHTLNVTLVAVRRILTFGFCLEKYCVIVLLVIRGESDVFFLNWVFFGFDALFSCFLVKLSIGACGKYFEVPSICSSHPMRAFILTSCLRSSAHFSCNGILTNGLVTQGCTIICPGKQARSGSKKFQNCRMMESDFLLDIGTDSGGSRKTQQDGYV
jgi:hypothetical protein